MNVNQTNDLSWGRYPTVDQAIEQLQWRCDTLPNKSYSLLPYGNGRSYGDSCLNDQNLLVHTRFLKHLISFDKDKGILRCESGVLLSEILEFAVPQGWFLAVTPGTKFATLGGCIANDVHGKNHHKQGSFAHHIHAFELLRSNGERILCSEQENKEWFQATIGGLGLTGLITWAEIQLKSIHNPFLNIESIRYGNIDEFCELSKQSADNFEYTVAWVDCLAKKNNLGRGLFIRANHCGYSEDLPEVPKKKPLAVPFSLPAWTLNRWSVYWFNYFYYRKQWNKITKSTVYYDSYFYPLDGIHHWNRIYGNRGFFQYQCVVPIGDYSVIKQVLATVSSGNTGSFLTVLKEFGGMPAKGLLSFPRPGITFALDFPNRGKRTLALMESLDQLVMQAGGAVYPAKDARMSEGAFKRYFPKWDRFIEFIDPKFSSSFWRRVTSQSMKQ